MRKFYCAIHHGTPMKCIIGNTIHCGVCLGCRRGVNSFWRHIHHDKKV